MRGNNQTLSGYFLGAELLLFPRAHALIAGLLDAIARGELRVIIDRAFPLAEAAAAHAYIESRRSFGQGPAHSLSRPAWRSPDAPASLWAMACSERPVR